MFFWTSKPYFECFLKKHDTLIPKHYSHFHSFYPNHTVPPIIYGIEYDTTYTAVIQQMVKSDGTLIDSCISSLKYARIPISLDTVFVMNQLLHCGERLNYLLKDCTVNNTVLTRVENAINSLVIGNDQVYNSFMDTNNKMFKGTIQNLSFRGCCFIVAFCICVIHSGFDVAYSYWICLKLQPPIQTSHNIFNRHIIIFKYTRSTNLSTCEYQRTTTYSILYRTFVSFFVQKMIPAQTRILLLSLTIQLLTFRFQEENKAIELLYSLASHLSMATILSYSSFLLSLVPIAAFCSTYLQIESIYLNKASVALLVLVLAFNLVHFVVSIGRDGRQKVVR